MESSVGEDETTAARSIDQIEFGYSIDRERLLLDCVADVLGGVVDAAAGFFHRTFALAGGKAKEEDGAQDANHGVGVAHARRLRAHCSNPSSPAIVWSRHVRCCQ